MNGKPTEVEYGFAPRRSVTFPLVPALAEEAPKLLDASMRVLAALDPVFGRAAAEVVAHDAAAVDDMRRAAGELAGQAALGRTFGARARDLRLAASRAAHTAFAGTWFPYAGGSVRALILPERDAARLLLAVVSEYEGEDESLGDLLALGYHAPSMIEFPLDAFSKWGHSDGDGDVRTHDVAAAIEARSGYFCSTGWAGAHNYAIRSIDREGPAGVWTPVLEFDGRGLPPWESVPAAVRGALGEFGIDEDGWAFPD